MSVTSVSSGVTAAAGTVVAAASGWGSPTGLAAFLTALVGAGALVWSIYQGRKNSQQVDVEAAAKLFKLMREQEAAEQEQDDEG